MPIMYDPPMPCPRPDFSPSQRIHPKWSGLEQIISISPPKTRHRIPTRGIVSELFSVWAASTAHNSQQISEPWHQPPPLLLPLQSPFTSTLVQTFSSGGTTASLTQLLPFLSPRPSTSNHPPHCRCPPGLNQSVDNALTYGLQWRNLIKKCHRFFFFELNVIGMVCWMNSYQ